MEAPQISDVVSGLQTVANGQPQALGQLVTQYAAGAVQQLVPAELGRLAAALPLHLDGGALRLAPDKLEGALTQVLGTLSPGALQTLQTITDALPGGVQGLLAAPADPQAWFGQVGSHLLQEALPPQLQQFAAAGQEVLLASAAPAGLSDVPTGLLPAFAPKPQQLAAAPAPKPAAKEKDKQSKKDKQPKKDKKSKKPPVKTGWLDAKKERYDQRMELIKKAESKRKDIQNPAFGKSIDRLKFNNVAIERWRLALDSYNYQVVTNPTEQDYNKALELGYHSVQYNQKAGQVLFRKGPPPEGWKVLEIVDDPSTGLNAVLYQSTFENGGRGKPVLVFAGTETNRIGGPGKPKDIDVDWNQAHPTFNSWPFPNSPVDPQYAQGIALGQRIVNRYGTGIDVVGHSLGGGIASAVSVVSNVRAFTINAAGLHQNTVASYGVSVQDILKKSSKVEAFHSSGDPLTQLQRYHHPKGPYADPDDKVPLAIGNQRTIGKAGHMGEDIEAEFEQQKTHDVEQLKHFLNSKTPNKEVAIPEVSSAPKPNA